MTRYEQIEKLVRDGPVTFLPGLLIFIVQECVHRRVFAKCGLQHTVDRAVAEATRSAPACDDSRMKPTREALERAVAGALRSAIEAHGPITADRIGSAAKRAVGNLVNAGVKVDGAESAPEAPSEKPL